MALISALQQSFSTLFFTESHSTAAQLGKQKIYHRFTIIVAYRHRVHKVFHIFSRFLTSAVHRRGRSISCASAKVTNRQAGPAGFNNHSLREIWQIWTFLLFELNCEWTSSLPEGSQHLAECKCILYVRNSDPKFKGGGNHFEKGIDC